MIQTIFRIMILSGLFLTVSARNSQRYPVKEIDRPIILPKNMGQVKLIQLTSFYIYSDGLEYIDRNLVGYLPSFPSYSLTDKLMWESIPFPYFRYLVTPKIEKEISSENPFSITLDGGIIGFYLSPIEGGYVYSSLGLSAKKKLSSRFWSEGFLNTSFANSDFGYTGINSSFGFQISDRNYLKASYGIVLFNSNSGILQSFSLTDGINFTSNMSLSFSAGSNLGLDIALLSFGSTLSFQW